MIKNISTLEKRIRKLERELAKIKRLNSKLKSQINIVKLVESESVFRTYVEDKAKSLEIRRKEKTLRETWLCYKCGRGSLFIKEYSVKARDRYYRECDNCNYKTKSKDKTKEIKGLTELIED